MLDFSSSRLGLEFEEFVSKYSEACAKKTFSFLELLESNDQLELADRFRRDTSSFSKLFVIGMGGSSLGALAAVNAFGFENKVYFLENSDPDKLDAFLKAAETEADPYFLFISKSGATVETLSILNLLLNKYGNHDGWKDISKRLGVITEEKDSPLHLWAKKKSVKVYEHLKSIGGRYSVLSIVGLAPLAYCGVNVSEFISGAKSAANDSKLIYNLSNSIYLSKKLNCSNSIFWIYSEKFLDFGNWLIQLWSESLGKALDDEYSVPMLCKGSRDQHSVLQLFMETKRSLQFWFIGYKYQPGYKGKNYIGEEFLNKSLEEIYTLQKTSTAENMLSRGFPCELLEFDSVDEKNLGALFMAFQLSIAMQGEIFGFNVFDQPGVETAKNHQAELLSKR